MGWSGSLSSNSSVGNAITWTPDNPDPDRTSGVYHSPTTYAGVYRTTSFTAKKKGIYRFQLYGSGGMNPHYSKAQGGTGGGIGGYTEGYLLLEENQTVYMGAGGCARAAWVSSVSGNSLAEISKSNLYFVAGAGGNGGSFKDTKNWTGYNCNAGAGFNGGGASGAGSTKGWHGLGGTQTAGGESTGAGSVAGSYGTGGDASVANAGEYNTDNGYHYTAYGGRGGDGLYGGSGGSREAYNNGANGYGGGGGSGYVYASTLKVGNKSFTSSTTQGQGAASDTAGYVVVTYYDRAELPVVFNNQQVMELYYNGQEVKSLYYNGTKIY